MLSNKSSLKPLRVEFNTLEQLPKEANRRDISIETFATRLYFSGEVYEANVLYNYLNNYDITKCS